MDSLYPVPHVTCRDIIPEASAQPIAAAVQTPSPMAIKRKALAYLLASANAGEATSNPTCMQRLSCLSLLEESICTESSDQDNVILQVVGSHVVDMQCMSSVFRGLHRQCVQHWSDCVRTREFPDVGSTMNAEGRKPS